MRTTAGQTAAARTFAAIPKAGHVAVADYANTHNPKLISADGTTTWALIDMRASKDSWHLRGSQSKSRQRQPPKSRFSPCQGREPPRGCEWNPPSRSTRR
jgi:hypothetical protein